MKTTFRKIGKTFKLYVGFPQIWVFTAILVLAVIMISLSLYVDDNFMSSVFSNIFAGLVTGLVISLLSGVRQIYLYVQQRKIAWLQRLHEMILEYLSMKHEFLVNNYKDDELDNYIYDMGAHVSWIKDYIQPASSDKRLPFNPADYCQKNYGFDVFTFEKKSDLLHDTICENFYTNKDSVIELFRDVESDLRKLNSNVIDDINNIEIRTGIANKMIV